MNSKKVWALWLGTIVLIAIYLTYKITGKDENKSMFLIGKMTPGHAQFGVKCSSCHLKSFAGKEDIQKACLSCHEKELKRADDKHPESKFTDPRNADRVAKLDARYCATCHTEHKPKATHAMGVTLPPDFCAVCHQDIGEERQSHKNLTFNTCQTAGCHNFHDNRALYEDFLVKHGKKPDHLNDQRLMARAFIKRYVDMRADKKKPAIVPVALGQEAIPAAMRSQIKVPPKWHQTAHAKAGVNCSECHKGQQGSASWVAKPTHQVCASCHIKEHQSFTEGKHGIRLKLKLSPMTPKMSSLPMKAKAAHKQLNCNSCHKPHQRDTKFAAVQACVSCHNSEHVTAYKKSPHYRLWQKEVAQQAKPNTGVSCASCHMPRRHTQIESKKYVWVEHNQNENLRPNEKMIRSVCMNCHGLKFSINALADQVLIKNNFSHKPGTNIKSIEWSLRRVKKKGKKAKN